MKIEKLTENKIRITLNIEDLKEKDIDLHTFMSNSIESQKIFLDMLDEAEKEVGFVTDDYKVMIEALALANGSFILTITKIDTGVSTEKRKFKKVNIKRKISDLNNPITIYKFSCFEDFCKFCEIFKDYTYKNIGMISKKMSLFFYNDNYFLLIQNINSNLPISKCFITRIVEHALPVHNVNLFIGKLQEYGKIIMKNNAINTCLKYFN